MDCGWDVAKIIGFELSTILMQSICTHVLSNDMVVSSNFWNKLVHCLSKPCQGTSSRSLALILLWSLLELSGGTSGPGWCNHCLIALVVEKRSQTCF